MRRSMVLMTVVALMMVMLAMSVAPAFAAGWAPATYIDPTTGETRYVIDPNTGNNIYCRTGDQAVTGPDTLGVDRNGNGWWCIHNGQKNRPYDDKLL